jgi:hypothetical protein
MFVDDVDFAGIDFLGDLFGQRERLAFGLQLGLDLVKGRLGIAIVPRAKGMWTSGVSPAAGSGF